MKYIMKFNENKIAKIKDLDNLKSGDMIDNEIKRLLYEGLVFMFNYKVDSLINELKSGKKISNMSEDSRIVLDVIAPYMKKEHTNKTYKSIPQKVKDLWDEDIQLIRDILIEYLELSKGSPYFFGKDKSKLPCQRLKE